MLRNRVTLTPPVSVVVVVVASLLMMVVDGFYLPGVSPREFQDGEDVQLKVNKLDSVKTQLPYEYYSLPFCRPATGELVEESENLGEILSGDLIESSLYRLRMKHDEVCKFVCPPVKYSDADLAEFADRIADEYRVNMIVDNLPAATKYFTESTDGASTEFTDRYEKGFAIGFTGSNADSRTVPGVHYVNNHLRLVLQYHRPASVAARANAAQANGDATAAAVGFRVVGFEVEPFSVKHRMEGAYNAASRNKLETCGVHNPVRHSLPPQPVSGQMSISDKTIVWTYDVKWEMSEVKWASRWDVYLKMTDSRIHWFSIINAIMVVLFLTGMIAMIMIRTLHKDLMRYNELDDDESQEEEETGWKLIYSEVFRPPAHAGTLSVLVGSGVQLIAMALLTIFFALLGFLSPANRGGLMTALLLLFAFMGIFAGYYSTRLYKTFKLTDWKSNTLWTAMAFPGLCFTIFFVLNLFVWGKKSSGAVPFTSLLALLVLWFGISVPLVYTGSYFAWKKPGIEAPVTVNHIPRMIPEGKWCLTPTAVVLLGGILPFGACFIEIFFIMSSVWLHQFYYLFGFLFVVLIILLITCAEIAIVVVYIQLCAEDYRWWWRSFLTPGASALYLFLYSILYFVSRLDITQFVPVLLFFGYMALVSVAFFLLTGTIGFVATYIFVYHIYSQLKTD